MKNYELALRLSGADWGLFRTDAKFCSRDLLREVEPVIHEVCHATALGFHVTRKAPDLTSNFFDGLNMRSKVMGLANEAHAFAIERHVLERLGWLRYFRFAALIEDVYENGLSGPSMPRPLFLRFYRALVREPLTKAMADDAMLDVERVARRRRRR